ncbi:MAG: hypothetical protein WDW38_010041 [Sanguina aurantia]
MESSSRYTSHSWAAPKRAKGKAAQAKAAAQLLAAKAHAKAVKLAEAKAAAAKPVGTPAENAAQLRAFIAGAGPAIGGVTHLSITLPATSESTDGQAATEAYDAMLLLLAAACPRLETLTVKGRVGLSVLQRFGSSCPGLTGFEAALPELSRATLEQLSTLLPNLASLIALRSEPSYATARYSSDNAVLTTENAICVALQACPGLSAFDMRGCSGSLKENIWNALPTSLSTLGCDAQSTWLLWEQEPWRKNPSLQQLQLSGAHFDITQLSSLLAAAPCVDALLTGGPLLGERLGAGLQMNGVGSDRRGRAVSRSDVAMTFTGWSGKRFDSDESSPGFEGDMADFMLELTQPLPNVTQVSFLNEHGYVQDGKLTQLPVLFPNLELLAVDNFDLRVKDVAALATCKKLVEVKLTTVDGVNVKTVQMLCARSESLQKVALCGMRAISIKEGRAIKRGMDGGPPGTMSGVEVSIERGYVLGAVDQKMNPFET